MRDSHKPPSGFPKPCILLRWRPLAKMWYGLKRKYRFLRMRSFMTRLLGPQYKRSRNRIEIDITYRCNLRCVNCNRSIARAPENLDISVDKIAQFVEESSRRSLRWRRIRLLGGEPTLHPQFMQIVELLRSYRARGNPCSIEIVTNGNGPVVNRQLEQLPADVWIENSRKKPGDQAEFRPFSTAPADDPAYSCASFANGCEIMAVCGMGLTPLGYYPCALAGGVDRIAGLRMGRAILPDPVDDMVDILEWSCRLCGRFKDGHHIPKEMIPLLTTEVISPSWERLYSEWKQRPPGDAHASQQ